MDKILDHVVVQGQRYDIVSPTAFGDYIETIGSACINPDGYAQGSTFLARLGNEQFYYEATAAITQGSAISEGTNCKRTTVTGREAELATEIETLGETVDSLNEALSNEVVTRSKLGAHNLLEQNNLPKTDRQLSATQSSDGGVYVKTSATTTSDCYIKINKNNVFIPAGDYVLSCTNVASGTDQVYVYNNTTSQTIASRNNPSFTYNGTDSLMVYYQLVSGKSVDKIIYPMIRLATDTDTTYQPYAMTNRELTKSVLYFTSVACAATTGNFATVSDSAISADHVVVDCVFANPSAITTDVTWTTSNGSVVLNGTCASATTANITLARKGN